MEWRELGKPFKSQTGYPVLRLETEMYSMNSDSGGNIRVCIQLRPPYPQERQVTHAQDAGWAPGT